MSWTENGRLSQEITPSRFAKRRQTKRTLNFKAKFLWPLWHLCPEDTVLRCSARSCYINVEIILWSDFLHQHHLNQFRKAIECGNKKQWAVRTHNYQPADFSHDKSMYQILSQSLFSLHLAFRKPRNKKNANSAQNHTNISVIPVCLFNSTATANTRSAFLHSFK